MKNLLYISIALLTAMLPLAAAAQSSIAMREQALLEGVGFDERPGETVDLQADFLSADGRSVRVGEFLEEGRPVVLNFAYYNCPVICSVMLDQIAASLEEVGLELGEDYEIVTVSFSADEGPELAERSRSTFRPKVAGNKGWQFLTGSQESIDRLAASTGFKFKWIEGNGEYAHPAALIFLSDEGQITRYLHGLQYPADDVRKALLEASKGKIGTVWDQVVMYCFRFDPSENSYVLQATNLMKLGGLITVVGLGFMLTIFWIRERRRQHGINLAAN